ncbi:MAG: UDP-N-acetylmuramate--L-alanine ligase [Bacteroidales bacterium]|nr:UDP-N-acetylmuramate--L-alanine ligase [Bacteroidales bacterium]MDD6782294.1 UDP-N-acetylmuramate--L-alanine ligase [Bacteroidales bacterium]
MNYKNIYFLGIGGIGMSAIARYFAAKGYAVAGYDRTRSRLCEELEAEGIAIHYTDDVAQIAPEFLHNESTLVVYTPAIPAEHSEFVYFRQHGFTIEKRAQVLGEITRVERGLCVAGTHGKTTTSTMLAHLLKQSHVDCNAFLGGIAKNYTSNLMLSDTSDLVVIEADEFDRSFHHLTPYMAVVTAVDADHLDIYGTHEAYLESFAHFTSLIVEGGCLIMKKGIALQPRLGNGVKLYTYSATEQADFCAANVRIGNGTIVFDFVTPTETIADIELGVPVQVNIENGVAAMAVAWLNGVSADELRSGMRSFAGIRRRFEIWLKTDRLTIIDDYAHHPAELEASIKSVKALYADKKVLGVFQPHLYTRTRDFYREFAAALSHLDEAMLVELYPAREEPIAGISSQTIYDEITCPKTLTTKAELINVLKTKHFDVLLTLGAGDLDAMLPQIVESLK